MRTTGGASPLDPNKDWIFCLEDLELAFEKEVHERILRMFNEGTRAEVIAEKEGRKYIEIATKNNYLDKKQSEP